MIAVNAAYQGNAIMQARYDRLNPGTLKRLAASGTQLRPFSNDILEAALKAAQDVYAETSAQNADFKKIYDSLHAFRNDEYIWWQVAEDSYDTYMIRSGPRA